MKSHPSGTVTFLFSDVVGSTALWEAAPEAMADSVARHDELLRGCFADHAGYVFATGGDGFAVVFSRAAHAVEAAVAAQRALGAHRWPSGTPIAVRMGIHSGEVQERDGDYFGSAVNRAARIAGSANGGEVLCSAVTVGLSARSDLFDFVDLGEVALKGIATPIAVFGLRAQGLTTPAPRPPRLGHLPAPPTDFVGRVSEVRDLAATIGGKRLVTLTGPGGVGKTRLAIEVAARAEADLAEGAWWVDLGALNDPGAVSGRCSNASVARSKCLDGRMWWPPSWATSTPPVEDMRRTWTPVPPPPPGWATALPSGRLAPPAPP